MFRSATFKLTMWYLGIVMIISLGFSVVVYHFATNELSYGLNSQTERIFRQFPVFSNNPYLQVRDNDVSVGAHHILLRLVYFNALVLAGAGFASYWLARRSLQPIEAAHDRQKRFTADVSHELRTPLTALKMGSEVALLDTQANKAELQAALRSNLEEAVRMEQLINNLLRLTKLDDDEIEAQFSALQSSTIIQDAVEQVQALANRKGIQINQDITDATIFGDADALTQLVVILLDNAIKYSPDKSTVHISTVQLDTTQQLQIRDEGQGISPEALPHVFERFYREDSARTTTNTGDGYGLGLSIAKMIADRNNATVTLTSTPKKGTTATITIPLGPTSAS